MYILYCIDTYMYIYTHIHIHIYTYMIRNVFIQVHVHIVLYRHIHVHIHTVFCPGYLEWWLDSTLYLVLFTQYTSVAYI